MPAARGHDAGKKVNGIKRHKLIAWTLARFGIVGTATGRRPPPPDERAKRDPAQALSLRWRYAGTTTRKEAFVRAARAQSTC